jgi:YYY domain-containing protein
MRESVLQPRGEPRRSPTPKRRVSRRAAVIEQRTSLYAVLGVEQDATEKRIRSAYRHLSEKYAAAAGAGDKRARGQLSEATAAFEVLVDTQQRIEYDRSLDVAGTANAASEDTIAESPVEVVDGPRRFNWRPPVFGIAGGLMLVIMGNLVWVLAFASSYGVGGRSFYDWVDVSGLGPRCGTPVVDPCMVRHVWYPARFFAFFNASRIYPLNGADFRVITEFPMFSFLLGDLHPHVMALPFVLLVVAVALSLYRSPEPLDVTFWLERPLLLVTVAIMIGGLAFINTWDIATMAFVVVAAAFVSNFLRVRRITRDLFVQVATFAAPLVVLAIVLYLPFYLSFASQADGIGAVVSNKDITVSATRPLHLFLFWGPLFIIVIPFVVARILPARARITRRMAAVCAAPSALVVTGWALLFLFEDATGSKNLGNQPGNLIEQIGDRGMGWITALFIAAMLATALMALWLELTSDEDGGERVTVIFPLTIIATAMLLILGTEFFFVGDVFRSRMNTVFKLYYQAWMLLAVAGGFALYYLATDWRLSFPRERQYRLAWGGAAVLILLGASLYPLGGTFNRIKPYNEQGKAIDTGGNLAGLTHLSADERTAIAYLNKLAQGQDLVIAEGVGNDYSDASRISAATGIPTILGWGGHEDQWRGGTAKARAGRFEDVENLYKTADVDVMNEILKKYGVTYVYVGDFERNRYGAAGMAKFQSLPSTSFGTVTIYRAAGVTGEVAAQ